MCACIPAAFDGTVAPFGAVSQPFVSPAPPTASTQPLFHQSPTRAANYTLGLCYKADSVGFDWFRVHTENLPL